MLKVEMLILADLRVLGDNLGSIDQFHIHDHTLKVVLQDPMRMLKRLALP
jgi:hypothetical protein